MNSIITYFVKNQYKTKYKFPGGFHQNKENIFKQSEEFDIDVPENDRVYEWFAVFDFEALLYTGSNLTQERK